MSTKYPREVAAVVRKTKTLAISASFSTAKAKDGDTPLAVYDKNFSRIIVAGLDKEAKGKGSATANISVSELAEIFARTEYAFKKHMDTLFAGGAAQEDSNTSSLAYTHRFPANSPLKGKTAAEILLEMGEQGMSILSQQHSYLKQNLAKYPNNATGMQALSEAANLFRQGKLTNKSMPVIPLYDAEAHALIRKKRPSDGFCPVHNLSISWALGDPSPVTVTVKNYYAPVVVQADGRINPQVKNMDKSSLTTVSMKCTSKEWMNVVRAIKAAMLQFETYTAKTCIEDAEAAERENRSAAGYTTQTKNATPNATPYQYPQANAYYQQPQPPVNNMQPIYGNTMQGTGGVESADFFESFEDDDPRVFA